MIEVSQDAGCTNFTIDHHTTCTVINAYAKMTLPMVLFPLFFGPYRPLNRVADTQRAYDDLSLESVQLYGTNRQNGLAALLLRTV